MIAGQRRSARASLQRRFTVRLQVLLARIMGRRIAFSVWTHRSARALAKSDKQSSSDARLVTTPNMVPRADPADDRPDNLRQPAWSPSQKNSLGARNVNHDPSNSAEGFDAWLVDLDGTLYRQGATRLAMALELLLAGPRKIRVIQRFRQEQELLRRDPSLASEIAPYQLQLNRTAAALGETVDSVAQVVREWMEQRPCKWLYLFRRRRLLAEIAAFRSRGGKTAVVSDYPATTKLVGLKAADLFDVVVACGEVGGPLRLKPSPEGYLLAAKRLGVAPSRCLIIGDRDDADGEAAQLAQMAYRRIT